MLQPAEATAALHLELVGHHCAALLLDERMPCLIGRIFAMFTSAVLARLEEGGRSDSVICRVLGRRDSAVPGVGAGR